MTIFQVTVCFLIISFSIGYTFGGWTVLVSKLFKESFCIYYMFFESTDFCRALTSKAYFIFMVVVLGGYLGFTMAYQVSKKTGPMNYTSVTYFFSFYIFVAMNWCFNDYLYYVELFTSRALLGGGYLVMWLYMPVYYHTQVRAVGVGLGICFTKLGTAAAAFVVCYTELPCKLYSFALFSLIVCIIAVLLSEPTLRRKLFSKTDQVLQVTDPHELYKHHHVSKNTLDWHIKYEKSKAKKPPPMPYRSFKTPGRHGRPNSVETDSPDFNWVDHSLSGSPTTIGDSSKSADLFEFDDFPDGLDLPIEAFMNREVYLSAHDRTKMPTFKFDRSKVIQSPEKPKPPPREPTPEATPEATPPFETPSEETPPEEPSPPKNKKKKTTRFYRALSQDGLSTIQKMPSIVSNVKSADNTPAPQAPQASDKKAVASGSKPGGSSRRSKKDELRRRVIAPSTSIAGNAPEDVEESERAIPGHLNIDKDKRRIAKRKVNKDKDKGDDS